MRFEDFNFRQRFAKKHPLLSQFSSSLPSNIKELFEWMEFIISNNPIASAGIKKLSETPVTNFKYYVQDDSEEVTLSNENSWKSILETQIDLKSHLLKISYNVLLYGNAFVSVYAPIKRDLICKKCRNRQSIEEAKKLKVKLLKGQETLENQQDSNNNEKDATNKLKSNKKQTTRLQFSCFCPKCNANMMHSVVDLKIKDISKINIILWNPHDIKIAHNPISGESEYYYVIPSEIKSEVKKNNKLFLSTLTMPMIDEMSIDDLESMTGLYMGNFILASVLGGQ